MGDYIKIEDAAMAFSIWTPYRYEDCMNDLIGSIADGAIELADVAPVVHAHWIVKKVGYAKNVAYCSACGSQAFINSRVFHEQGADVIEYSPVTTKYCPDCGAKMDEKGKPE